MNLPARDTTWPDTQIERYARWLAQTRGLHFDPCSHTGYDAMWRWSVNDLPAFWGSLWDYFALHSPTPFEAVLADDTMPGARWFPGARLNYVQQVFRHAEAAEAAGQPAIVFQDEAMREIGARGEIGEWRWPELRQRVASLASHLARLGVRPGDRVCAFLPNAPQTVVAFLATASLGAVWSVCSPDMGPMAVLDRFRQIEPKVLIACSAYRYGGVQYERMDVVREVVGQLPSLSDVVVWGNVGAGTSMRAQHVPCPEVSKVQSERRSGSGSGSDSDADSGAGGNSGAGGKKPVRTEVSKSPPPTWHDFNALTADDVPLAPLSVPFDHPLWIVYSSGTTGLPKPIVHGHGGVVIEALKLTRFHLDLAPSAESGDRFHWYSATGWIMWNCQVGGLLNGTTICLYDGSPNGPHRGGADPSTLWRFADEAGATFFGAGSAFFANCHKAGLQLAPLAGFARLRAVGATGSPLTAEAQRWVIDQLPARHGRPIWLDVISGGTDFAGAFIAGLPTLPVVEGEMQCRCLGAAVEAWNERGEPLVDAVGELVCTRPLPSMPLYFWNDGADTGRAIGGGATHHATHHATRNAERDAPSHARTATVAPARIEPGPRYRESYFDMYPGVWRHGDWARITPRGGAVIYGRSDATINRHGIRMGTAELYRAVEALPEVIDSLVVDLEYLGRESEMPLFVVLQDGARLDEALKQRINAAIRSALSARHVPNDIHQVPAIPRTLSGKKMELPVKKLLLGARPDEVFKLDAMDHADAVPWFVQFAQARGKR